MQYTQFKKKGKEKKLCGGLIPRALQNIHRHVSPIVGGGGPTKKKPAVLDTICVEEMR